MAVRPVNVRRIHRRPVARQLAFTASKNFRPACAPAPQSTLSVRRGARTPPPWIRRSPRPAPPARRQAVARAPIFRSGSRAPVAGAPTPPREADVWWLKNFSAAANRSRSAGSRAGCAASCRTPRCRSSLSTKQIVPGRNAAPPEAASSATEREPSSSSPRWRTTSASIGSGIVNAKSVARSCSRPSPRSTKASHGTSRGRSGSSRAAMAATSGARTSPVTHHPRSTSSFATRQSSHPNRGSSRNR